MVNWLGIQEKGIVKTFSVTHLQKETGGFQGTAYLIATGVKR
jgi:hypothetical protein